MHFHLLPCAQFLLLSLLWLLECFSSSHDSSSVIATKQLLLGCSLLYFYTENYASILILWILYIVHLQSTFAFDNYQLWLQHKFLNFHPFIWSRCVNLPVLFFWRMNYESYLHIWYIKIWCALSKRLLFFFSIMKEVTIPNNLSFLNSF